ncbi:MAG TPA: protein-L-isoaspartate(D-aspartate) O-methyltransferase [Labilithrix sp.]|nr:protein-L-isoaspartate(D-aspartate) O-methyltransferase [Labilithrix sp.]
MNDLEDLRFRMVEGQLAQRGITAPFILDAFRSVPREAFVPDELVEFAYEDTPLPIGEGQTISQPYIVALTLEALELQGGERVLEIGTGSGYATAVLGRIAKDVYTVERIESLATAARERLRHLGYSNVHVRCADGSHGWPEHAPYDAIAVAAGGPKIPEPLLAQLALGGRLVMPVGKDPTSQTLVRVTRESETEFRQEDVSAVHFVPLVGKEGWRDQPSLLRPPAKPSSVPTVARLVREVAEPFEEIESASVDALLERIGDARVVLLGESSHGTSEFYRMRARITQALIARRGFSFVAVEADWPDAARIDDYVLGGKRRSNLEFTPFERFPTWMWRNEEVHDFVDWLRAYNADHPERKVGFHGLDLYSLFTSIAAVLHYLEDVDPHAAKVARHRYAALTPWQKDPAAYGEAVLVGRYESSERAVVAILREMLERRMEYARRNGDRFFDAAQNARVVANAERYYRSMYYGSHTSWNLRDEHMFDTLEALLAFHGPGSKGIVWEHNSHVGNAAATEMSLRGEHNVGQLCRTTFGDRAYIVGFGTDHGTVAAASNWDEPMQTMTVRPSHRESYEYAFHESTVPTFMLSLREPRRPAVFEELEIPRLERAIGVIYRPETELASHYFYATLPHQFDEYIWFDETRAVSPLAAAPRPSADLPETYPFGL